MNDREKSSCGQGHDENKLLMPELIQSDFTPGRVAAETVAFLTDRELHARTREALRRVREKLGAPGASGRAADAILDVARRGVPPA